MADDALLSKALSLWLRHKPENAGLMLDEGGWADIRTVVTALGRVEANCDLDRLVKVVTENDKQRFEISDDATRIRARQGHSIGVVLDWPVTTPPLHLFHGTVTRSLESIMRDGLKPMRRHHVHLSPSVELAHSVGGRRGTPAVLIVRAMEMAEAGHVFMVTSNGVWLTERVPSAYLQLVNQPNGSFPCHDRQ